MLRALRLGDLALVDEIELDLRREQASRRWRGGERTQHFTLRCVTAAWSRSSSSTSSAVMRLPEGLMFCRGTTDQCVSSNLTCDGGGGFGLDLG